MSYLRQLQVYHKGHTKGSATFIHPVTLRLGEDISERKPQLAMEFVHS
jgi:hypothetical protein